MSDYSYTQDEKKWNAGVYAGESAGASVMQMDADRPALDTWAFEDLCRAVAEQGDERALEELVCHRTPFCLDPGRRVRLADYLLFLVRQTEQAWKRHAIGAHAATAYDMTLDKFTTLWGTCLGTPPDKEEPDMKGRKRVDCRKYYRAFLAQCEARLSGGSSLDAGQVFGRTDQDSSPLIRENEVCWLFQKFVRRHYFLSRAEALRNANPCIHRYTWETGVHTAPHDGTITVYMPRSMTGKEKHVWLDRHVPREWLVWPDRRDRVQTFIDEMLLHEILVPLDEEIDGMGARPVQAVTLEGSPVLRFAFLLGEEKAAHLDRLQPSIRHLGATRLKELISDIFRRLTQDNGSEGTLAQRYGLSKASFSRFAGSEWGRKDVSRDAKRVPVLWANMAGQLARNAAFRQAAEDAGWWDFIRKAAEAGREHMEEEA